MVFQRIKFEYHDSIDEVEDSDLNSVNDDWQILDDSFIVVHELGSD